MKHNELEDILKSHNPINILMANPLSDSTSFLADTKGAGTLDVSIKSYDCDLPEQMIKDYSRIF